MKNVDHHAERISLAKMAKCMVATISSPVDHKVVVGLLTDGIFQREAIFSGFISKEAAELSYNQRTKEHFHGRKKSARELVNIILEMPSISVEELAQFIYERSYVHLVTKKQNMQLRSYMKANPLAHHDIAYKECGIELIEYVGSKKVKKVSINGKIYNSAKDVAEAFGITVNTVYIRLYNNKKWCNWMYVE